MTEQEFIDQKISEGFKLSTYKSTSTIFLTKGMMGISISEDGSVRYSDPGQSAKFASIQDFLSGNESESTKYSTD